MVVVCVCVCVGGGVLLIPAVAPEPFKLFCIFDPGLEVRGKPRGHELQPGAVTRRVAHNVGAEVDGWIGVVNW